MGIEYIVMFLFSALCGALVCSVVSRHRLNNVRRMLDETMGALSQGVIYFDSNDRLCRFNETAGLLLPALGKKINSVDELIDFAFAHKLEPRVGNNKISISMLPILHRPREFRETIQSGEFFCLLETSQTVQGELIVFLTDITELKIQEAHLSQSQKLEAIGQLAGGVAHDFNNVLAIIEGYARIASNQIPAKEEELAKCMDRILKASKRGAALTKQLLMFGSHHIVHENVIDLSVLIREQSNLLVPLLHSSVELRVDVDDHICVSSCADAMGQILMNLVINARDAMPDGGVVNLAAHLCLPEDVPQKVLERHPETPLVRLSVVDTGMGMDKKTIDRMFEPFFTTKEQGAGTGLGLSMVYGLVNEMSGVLDVHSEPGEGTRIDIYLPRSSEGVSKEIIDSADNEAGIRFEGYVALVAEDEDDLRELVCSMLEELGMEVIRASNGAEALLLQDEYEGDIDLLLSDVVMPELNGVKLVELMQAVREETHCIYMSGFPATGKLAQIDIPEEAVLLAKPFKFETLASVIKAVLDEDSSILNGSGVSVWQEVGT